MNLFTILNVPIRISPILLLMMAGMLVLGQGNMLFIIIISVGVHEIGHALCARALNMKVQEVYFFPLGGVSKMNTKLENAGWKETVISLFGPLINITMACIAYAIQENVALNFSLWPFITTNITLAAFNLLPALPLDGGRALRAMMMSVVGKEQATNVCVRLSYLISIGFVALFALSIYMDMTQWMLLPIGVFLFMGARQEKKNCTGYFGVLSNKTAAFNSQPATKMRYVAVPRDTKIGDVIKTLPHTQICKVVVMDEDLHTLYEMDEGELVSRAIDKGLDNRLGSQKIDRP